MSVKAGFPDVMLLSCGIGRGHPFYLDGIQQALKATNPEITVEYRSVFDFANPPSLLGWKLAKLLYQYGSQGGKRTEFYEAIRGADRPPAVSDLLRNGLAARVARYRNAGTIVIVDHPLLAVNLAEEVVWYQHGELVAPESSLVDPGGVVFVPTTEVAKRFESAGVEKDRITVTNSCIEPEIEQIAQSAASARVHRLTHEKQLCAAVFSSGAEPAPHLLIIESVIASLLQNDHRVVCFASKDGQLSRKLRIISLSKSGLLELITFRDRHELHDLTVARWAEFDMFFSPYHERIHWAAAAGLPHFGYLPAMGPFAPLNRLYALKYGLSQDVSLDAASDIGLTLADESVRMRLASKVKLENWIHASGGFDSIALIVSKKVRQH